jgi:hypothetical protein
MSWPTTRRYSRTLAEAFPDVRAASIERPPRGLNFGQAAAVMLAVALGLLGAALLVHFLTPCAEAVLC